MFLSHMLMVTLNLIAQLHSGAIWLLSGLNLHLLPYFVHESRDDFSETAQSEPLLLADAISTNTVYVTGRFLNFHLKYPNHTVTWKNTSLIHMLIILCTRLL